MEVPPRPRPQRESRLLLALNAMTAYAQKHTHTHTAFSVHLRSTAKISTCGVHHAEYRTQSRCLYILRASVSSPRPPNRPLSKKLTIAYIYNIYIISPVLLPLQYIYIYKYNIYIIYIYYIYIFIILYIYILYL